MRLPSDLWDLPLVKDVMIRRTKSTWSEGSIALSILVLAFRRSSFACGKFLLLEVSSVRHQFCHVLTVSSEKALSFVRCLVTALFAMVRQMSS